MNLQCSVLLALLVEVSGAHPASFSQSCLESCLNPTCWLILSSSRIHTLDSGISVDGYPARVVTVHSKNHDFLLYVCVLVINRHTTHIFKAQAK